MFSYSALPKALREAGLTVVELPGWKSRRRPGPHNPVGVLWHHTGGAADSRQYVEWMAYKGRNDLPAPLCQISVSREGIVYLLAGGRANHAGKARASGSVAAGDGNSLYIGVECLNTGSEGWGKAQRNAMVKVGAVLAQELGTSVKAQRAHRETSVTGKWDPGRLDMDNFRADINREILNRRVVADLRVMTANVKELPRHDATIGGDLEKLSKVADLVLWQELGNGVYQKKLRGLSRLKAIIPKKGSRVSTPISFRPSKLTLISSRAKLVQPGIKNVTGNRYLTTATLRTKSGVKIKAHSTHFIARAWHPNGTKAKRARASEAKEQPFRQKEWLRMQVLVLVRVTKIATKGVPQVLGADANRQRISYLPKKIAGRRVQSVRHGIDWLHFVDGKDHTWVLNGEPKPIQTHSDHPAILQSARLVRR